MRTRRNRPQPAGARRARQGPPYIGSMASQPGSMASQPSPAITLLPGARTLLAFHARELPQRDDLCGAFCGALALRAAGIEQVPAERTGELADGSPAGAPAGAQPVDQDAVALAAGSVVSAPQDTSHLPHGERGRRDYRLAPPFVKDAALSGTTAAGVVHAIEQLSGGALAAIPYSGPWTVGTLGGLFETVAALERPVTLIANLATHHLWGGNARLDQLLAHLYEGEPSGPPPDWNVGHFVCVFGRVQGPRGVLYGVADTYPSLGRGGVHMQPAEHLASAIERRDKPAGGVVVVLAAGDAPHVREGALGLGLREGVWDNGTVTMDPSMGTRS
jgi:hypothetical protein